MSTLVFPPKLRTSGPNGEGLPSIRFSPNSKELTEDFQSIQLYLPSGLQFTDGASYSGVELGTIAAARSTIEKLSAEGGKKDILSNNETLVAGLKILDKMGADQNAIASTALAKGVAFNPQTALAFESMNMRQFSFSFTLVPESEKEAFQIRDIETFFRKYMYTKVEGFISKYPPVFRIQFFDGNSDEESIFMPMIYDAYLSGLDVTINPEGNSFHKTSKGYAPTSTTLSLTFQEGRMLSRDDLFKEKLSYNYDRPEGPISTISPSNGEAG